ncbi:MAG: SDR family NAD(P)-dependent oxidoreductase [Ruminococcaceae bacterium]|nr:SDR family NAD(P)-dependent oxidoreductase [Oscillospiraceae bacterium]
MNRCWFDYKTVIITGASSGMGKGLAERLIRDHNCQVIGVARTESKLQAFKEELGNKSHYFTYYPFDVSVKENWEKFAQQLKKDGIQPDILINNAGILPKFNRFSKITVDDVNNTMQINFYSAIYSINALLPTILQSKTPGIVNIASSAALCSLAGTTIYSASKSALKSFTDALREEHRKNCYVGLVCPGFTKTDIFRNQGKSSDKTQKALNMVSTDCDKMVDLIEKGIWKKRADMVFGMDAHAMSIGNKLLGTTCSRLASKVLEIADLSIFREVFRP